MKTLRDALLARHAAATPRLDALRRQTIESAFPASQSAPVPPHGFTLWGEVFARARAAWIGLGTAALVALGLDLAVPVGRLPATPPDLAPAEWVADARREQARLLAELLPSAPRISPAQPEASPAAPVPRHPGPGPGPGQRRSSLDAVRWFV